MENTLSGYSERIELDGQEYLVKGFYDEDASSEAYINYTRSIEDIREKNEGKLEELANRYL